MDMTMRHLFLVGYDISDHSRRRHILRDVQCHSLGGQKSFYECWLTVGELQSLMAQMRQRIDVETDRVVFVRLDSRIPSIQMGSAQAIVNTDYFYIE
jgi:CRISPR-associated protein Cas2